MAQVALWCCIQHRLAKTNSLTIYWSTTPGKNGGWLGGCIMINMKICRCAILEIWMAWLTVSNELCKHSNLPQTPKLTKACKFNHKTAETCKMYATSIETQQTRFDMVSFRQLTGLHKLANIVFLRLKNASLPARKSSKRRCVHNYDENVV